MLTTDEERKLESLMTEYANASMDVVRASQRRRDALRSVQTFIERRDPPVSLPDDGIPEFLRPTTVV